MAAWLPQLLSLKGHAGNHFSSEALEGALPKHQNSPQVLPEGLPRGSRTGAIGEGL